MENDGSGPGAILALLFGGVGLVFLAALYVYVSYCLMVIAKKTGNTQNLWMAWVPIAQIVLMCQIAGKPSWWVILVFVPCVNIVILILLWMGIAERRGKPAWLALLMLVPVANLILPGYLAFAD